MNRVLKNLLLLLSLGASWAQAQVSVPIPAFTPYTQQCSAIWPTRQACCPQVLGRNCSTTCRSISPPR